ncbi:MAG: hypothetical protein M3R01_12150, partial [Actinomycetota bacterium]|nr:hypothetical protein [Actinomycetota bacterium]
VVAGVGMLWGLALAANRGSVEVNLGDPEFRAGRVDSLADAVEREGPIPFSDVAGGDRDIVVQHLGTEDGEGWSAFDARVAGAARDCAIQWQPDDEEFLDPCSGTRYPADGEGLRQYEVRVTDRQLLVDLRRG